MCHGDAPREGCDYSDMTPRKLFMLQGCQIRRHPGRGPGTFRGAPTRERASAGGALIFEGPLSDRGNPIADERIAANNFSYLTVIFAGSDLAIQVVKMSSSLKEDHLMRAHSSRFAAALLALALGPTSVFAQTPDAVGVVTTLSGHATVARVGLTEPASMRFRDPVFTRDRISTGEKSIVRVLLGGKAVVTARELSVLTINEEPLRSTVILGSGKVGASVLKDRMKSGETIEFRTPNAVAVVRGTVLVVEVTEGPVPASGGPAPVTTTVSVIHGAVDVFALKGGTMTPVRVGSQESVRVTEGRLGTLQTLTPPESRALTADLEVAPDRQHQTKSVPQDVRRAIGAREQAKAAALVGALAPAAGTSGATRADTSALTADAVKGVTGTLDGEVGSVDNVLLEASRPVLELGGKVVGTVGTVVTATTDTVLGQGTVGTVSGSSGNTVGGVVTGISTSVGGSLTGGSLTGSSLKGSSLTGSSLTGTSLTGTSPTSGGGVTSTGGGTSLLGGVTGTVTGVVGPVTGAVGGLLRR